MRMPNLFWRGMIITMIPLALQLVIVIFLAYFLLTIKNEIVTESRSQEIIARAFVLNRDALETIYNMSFSFEILPEATRIMPKLPGETPQQVKTLNENMQSLFDVARTDEESAAKMRELYSCHKQLIEMFNDAHSVVVRDAAERAKLRKKYFRRFIQFGGEYANATHEIVALEEARQARRPALISKSLEKVWLTLFGALALSAVLAAILGYFYIAMVKRPLRQTCQNGRMLAKGEELPPPLQGTDELATLDRLIHSTAAALAKVESDEKALVENAADLICSLSEDGFFLSANPFAVRMLGWTPEQLQVRNLNELTIPEESFTCDQRLREARKSTEISVFDLRLQTANKTLVDTRWSCFWSDAQKAFFCVAHDITEVKNAERMKQELVDMISHDLRSPLTSVNISLAILSRGAKGTLPKAEKEKVDLARKTVEHLIELVSDLMDYQKLRAKDIELEKIIFNLRDIAESVSQAAEAHAEHKDLVIDITGEPAKLLGDKPLVTQALTAALGNAIKAAPLSSVIQIEITEIGDTVQVRLSDQGEGLSTEEIAEAEMVTPAHKLSSGGNRSLLKFSICKQIIEAHSGNVSFQNAKPQGFNIIMRLPKNTQ